jgi:hypothetical protein
MTLLEELAALVEQLGLGTHRADVPGGTIFYPRLPAAPDRCLAIALYGGPPSDPRLPHDAPSVQIRVRGEAADSRIAENDAQQVYDRLHGLEGVTLAGGTWLQHLVGVNSGPVYIGPDENNRDEYTVNFRCEISRPTPNRSDT